MNIFRELLQTTAEVYQFFASMPAPGPLETCPQETPPGDSQTSPGDSQHPHGGSQNPPGVLGALPPWSLSPVAETICFTEPIAPVRHCNMQELHPHPGNNHILGFRMLQPPILGIMLGKQNSCSRSRTGGNLIRGCVHMCMVRNQLLI